MWINWYILENHVGLPNKLNNNTHDTATLLLLDIYLIEMYMYVHPTTCLRIFTEIVLIVSNEWLYKYMDNALCYMHTMECSTAMTINELFLHARSVM